MISINQEIYDHNTVEWGASLSFPNTRTIKQYSHQIFNRYPARSICLVPRAILKSINDNRSSKEARIHVLDPFMGSGTTAVEARLQGMIPYGLEIDPFARLVTEVRVRTYSKRQIEFLSKLFLSIKNEWKGFNVDHKLAPELYNVTHWFDEQQYNDLLRIKNAIYHFTSSKSVYRDFFRIILADMIRPCSKIERQTLKPYISKKYFKKPADVGATFEKSFLLNIEAARDFSQIAMKTDHPISWIGNDGTDFNSGNTKIDVAITSPPYINALDYVRCIKIESSWVDCGDNNIFSTIQKNQVGGHSRHKNKINSTLGKKIQDYANEVGAIDKTRGKVIESYFDDMYGNIYSTYKCLRRGGSYHIIIGDSVIRGCEIPTHELLSELAEIIGFKSTSYYLYSIKDHRTSIPRKNQGGKIKVEHVLSLKKP